MSLRRWLGNARFAWEEQVCDRARRRPLCPLLPALRADPSLAGRAVDVELDLIFRRVVGRRLSPHILGNHPRRQSLTDFIGRGAAQAERLLPYLRSHETLMEFGGGVGRLGRSVAPHVRRLVSVDIEPLLAEYGRRLSPDVEFVDSSDLPAMPLFDGAYSNAVFFHLSLDSQRRALEYVHARLKPGGWFLVDLKIGRRTTAEDPRADNTATTGLDDFKSLYEPLFSARRVPLFHDGFLMTRKEPTDTMPARLA